MLRTAQRVSSRPTSHPSSDEQVPTVARPTPGRSAHLAAFASLKRVEPRAPHTGTSSSSPQVAAVRSSSCCSRVARHVRRPSRARRLLPPPAAASASALTAVQPSSQGLSPLHTEAAAASASEALKSLQASSGSLSPALRHSSGGSSLVRDADLPLPVQWGRSGSFPRSLRHPGSKSTVRPTGRGHPKKGPVQTALPMELASDTDSDSSASDSHCSSESSASVEIVRQSAASDPSVRAALGRVTRTYRVPVDTSASPLPTALPATHGPVPRSQDRMLPTSPTEWDVGLRGVCLMQVPPLPYIYQGSGRMYPLQQPLKEQEALACRRSPPSSGDGSGSSPMRRGGAARVLAPEKCRLFAHGLAP